MFWPILCIASTFNPTTALLHVIAEAEGTGQNYNIVYGYRAFKDYSDHPRQPVCRWGICSTAAGRYQFLMKTWDRVAKRLELTDFRPHSQDSAAIFLIKERGIDPDRQIKKDSWPEVMKALGKEWASLPGSPYGQRTITLEESWKLYLEGLLIEEVTCLE